MGEGARLPHEILSGGPTKKRQLKTKTSWPLFEKSPGVEEGNRLGQTEKQTQLTEKKSPSEVDRKNEISSCISPETEE